MSVIGTNGIGVAAMVAATIAPCIQDKHKFISKGGLFSPLPFHPFLHFLFPASLYFIPFFALFLFSAKLRLNLAGSLGAL